MLHVPAWETQIRASLENHQLLLPLLVAVAAVTGLVLQHSEMRKREQEEAAAGTGHEG